MAVAGYLEHKRIALQLGGHKYREIVPLYMHASVGFTQDDREFQ